MKKCSRCRVKKELDEFHKNRSRKDGRQSYCKKCRALLGKELRASLRFVKRETGEILQFSPEDKGKTYPIYLTQNAYRQFENECNLSSLSHDEMILALLRVYDQHVTMTPFDEPPPPDDTILR